MPNAKAKWTFMVYLAGDNNLSDAGETDIAEMRTVGSSDQVNVVVQFDNAGIRGTQRIQIQKKGINEQIEQLPETDSGDPKTLLEFIKWTAKKFPADRYALVLWNHGGGWEPDEMDRVARSVNSPGYSTREISTRSSSRLGKAFFRTTLEAVFALPSASTRAICSDDGSGHSLDTIELGKVLKAAVKALGQPIDLLGMDACLMSNLEVAYQAKPYVQFMVGSEETEPNEGWPYNTILSKLIKQPEQTTAAFATHIVNAYVKSYGKAGADSITQSAFDLSKIEEVITPLNTLAKQLIQAFPDSERNIAGAQKRAKSFFDATLWDISHFALELNARVNDSKLKASIQSLQNALEPGANNFILASAHTGVEVEHCGGLSVYLPFPGVRKISQYYPQLEYAKKTQWLKLLQAYQDAD
jgi:Clostripain family